MLSSTDSAASGSSISMIAFTLRKMSSAAPAIGATSTRSGRRASRRTGKRLGFASEEGKASASSNARFSRSLLFGSSAEIRPL